MATYLPDVTTIQPAQSNNETGPVICVDNDQRQYFVNRLFIQPIVLIHTKKNQSVYRGVLRKEIEETQVNSNKQVYYFVYTERHEDINQANGVHVTFEENNTRNIPCYKIDLVGRTSLQLELDNNNCETINDFISGYGDAISSNIPIEVINFPTYNKKKGCIRKKRGLMKDDDLHVIILKYDLLLKTIDVQYIKSFLIEQFILDREDIDHLNKAAKVSRVEATEKLLNIIMYESGSNVFPIFVKCLYDAGYEDLVNEL